MSDKTENNYYIKPITGALTLILLIATTVIGIQTYIEKQITKHLTSVDHSNYIGQIPENAVIPFFNLKVDSSGSAKCPQGWEEVIETRGRFILGSSPIIKYSVENNFENPIRYMRDGGDYKIILNEKHLPEHNHGIYAQRIGQIYMKEGRELRMLDPETIPGEPSNKLTMDAGSGVWINNMPPYISLTYCKINKTVNNT